MIKRRTFFATVAAVILALLAPITSSTAASPSGDWASVDRVLVDAVGGVSVAGQVSCEGALARLEDGQLAYAWDENGEPIFVPAPGPDELVNLFANTDNYTVYQALGRKTMLQVTHGSSQMTPCIGQYPYEPTGNPWAERYLCAAGGAPCPWETNVYNYDRETMGPLFDYAANGAFKPGKVSVKGYSVGLLVMIYDTAQQTWREYFIEEGTWVPYAATLRAVSYR